MFALNIVLHILYINMLSSPSEDPFFCITVYLIHIFYLHTGKLSWDKVTSPHNIVMMSQMSQASSFQDGIGEEQLTRMKKIFWSRVILHK